MYGVFLPTVRWFLRRAVAFPLYGVLFHRTGSFLPFDICILHLVVVTSLLHCMVDFLLHDVFAIVRLICFSP